MDFPCTICSQVFYNLEELYSHVQNDHMKKSDFHKIDHHYVTALDGFHLSVEATKNGFRLVVYGTLMEKPEPVLQHGEPTERQWEELLITADAFARGLRIAKNKESG